MPASRLTVASRFDSACSAARSTSARSDARTVAQAARSNIHTGTSSARLPGASANRQRATAMPCLATSLSTTTPRPAHG